MDQWVEEDKRESKGSACMKLEFQVADVKKPLIAVKRIAEKGNHVAFGPGKDDDAIEKRKAGFKIPMRENGNGSYLMDVEFTDGTKGTITVDSGAEESVCPWDWGKQFPMVRKGALRNFRNASGGNIPHWGSREVILKSPF